MGCGKHNVESSSHQGERRHHDGCVCEVVKTILNLQNRAVRNDCDSCGTSCFLEPLGGLVSPARSQADTRVFMLLNKDGTPFSALFMEDNRRDRRGRGRDGDGDGGRDGGRDGRNRDRFAFSPFFRVEDVFGDCCATIRVVAGVDDEGKVVEVIDEEGKFDLDKFEKIEDFEKTNSCLTVDLECFCGIQCIADVDLNICN